MKIQNGDICAELLENGQLVIDTRKTRWSTQRQTTPSVEIERCGQTVLIPLLEALRIRQEEYRTGYCCGVRTYYEGFSPCPELSFALFAEIEAAYPELRLGIIPLSDPDVGLRRILWPVPMDFPEKRPDHYTVYPLQQGCLIPNDWQRKIDLRARWELDAGMPMCRSAYMPWFGQIRGREGYMLRVDTPFDAGFQLEHPAGGACHVGVIWHAQLGKLAQTRRCSFVFFEDCDYNDLCSAFRAYLNRTGELRTLQEKIIRNPAVGKLIGTSIYHTEMVKVDIQPESRYYNHEQPEKNRRVIPFSEMTRRVETLKERGMERVFVHLDGWPREGYDNQHPDPFPPCPEAGGWDGIRSLCARTQALGFQFAIHDQYRDYFKRAPSYDPELSVRDADGNAPGIRIWYGGEEEYLCPEFQPGFVRRNFAEWSAHGVRLDGAYLDVFSCVPPDECFAPLHRVTREQCVCRRKECFDHVRSMGLIVSSEEGVGWALRELDLVHHAPYVHDWKPDPEQLCGEILPEAVGIPVPLLNLVYHDCVVIPWDMDAGIDRQSGFLHALLNGGVVYVEPGFSEEKLEQVKRAAAWHRQVGLLPMVRHEFLTPDRQIQRTTFADGSSMTVDFAGNTYEARLSG